jgi:hypothetical protein
VKEEERGEVKEKEAGLCKYMKGYLRCTNYMEVR